MLQFYGVRDHQVKNTRISARRAIYLLAFRVVEASLMLLVSAPMMILGSPLILLSQRVSHKKAIEAKAGSKVKIAGKDVITTWKLLTALVVAPLLWTIYSASFESDDS